MPSSRHPSHRTASLVAALRARVGEEAVLAPPPVQYLSDATVSRGIKGHADAVVLPQSASAVANVVNWCYEHDVPIVPRGGGTGFAGGAVPDGGVVLGLERLERIRSFDPFLWRMEGEAGLTTSAVRRQARQNGLIFPPDPGAAEQSQLGGNVATNAGGPHAFKYGVTGKWVTGLEVVLAPGEVVTLGGALPKDTAGYDLKSLMIGSEGTLGIITSVWLRLVPAPEDRIPAIAFYTDPGRGCQAIQAVLGNGIQAAALEYFDASAFARSSATFPVRVEQPPAFTVLAEADGALDEARRVHSELVSILSDGARGLYLPSAPREIEALWRWRESVSLAVTASLGRKLSDDVVVPVDRLSDVIVTIVECGQREGIQACSWGHAGDGNIHASFLFRPDDDSGPARAERASSSLVDVILALQGSAAGEHGVGIVKRNYAARQLDPAVLRVQARLKSLFDPKGLLNPGKKLPDLVAEALSDVASAGPSAS